MSTTETGDSTNYPTSITIPSDGDGPGIKAADVNPAFEGLADRSEYLKAQQTPLASLAALTAIAAPANGFRRYVVGQGPYSFDSSSSATVASPFILAADDATPGRWIAGHAYATTKTVVAALVPFGIAATGGAIAEFASGSESSATTFMPPSSSIYTELQVGQGGIEFNATYTAGSSHYGFVADLTRYMHDGATLTSAKLWLRASGAAVLPPVKPAFGIMRGGIAGASAALLSTGGGLTIDTSASTAALLAVHSITFTPDQNNVISRSQYTYHAQVWDSGGASSQVARFYGIELTFTIPDGRQG